MKKKLGMSKLNRKIDSKQRFNVSLLYPRIDVDLLFRFWFQNQQNDT